MKLFSYLLRIPVPWVYVLTYLIALIPQFIFPVHIHSEKVVLIIRLAGTALFIIGLLIAAWSLLIFRKARTTTTPGEKSAKLIRTGPYRVTRNPMYISLLLAYTGEAGFLVHVWPVIFLPLIFSYVNFIVIPVEEERLKADYGEDYLKFCEEVPRWL